MDPSALLEKTPELLKETNHHNVYVYTKDLAERYIERHRGNLRTVILRPSVVVACCREPFTGWTDTVSAGGGIGFPMSMGIQKNFHTFDGPTDFIPGDIVSNAIIASCVQSAKFA